MLREQSIIIYSNSVYNLILVLNKTAIIDNGSGDWYYFYWGPERVSPIDPKKNIKVELVPKEYKLNNGTIVNPLEDLDQLKGWLKDSGIYNGEYDQSVYINGDFSKSVEYAKNLKENANKKNNLNWYIVTNNNCMKKTIEVISQGKINNDWWSTQEFKHLVGGFIQESTVPNIAQKILQKYFDNKLYVDQPKEGE